MQSKETNEEIKSILTHYKLNKQARKNPQAEEGYTVKRMFINWQEAYNK